jgi:hypothetical protein
MQRHKYSEALAVLKDIINKKYGTYKLMANYGDNFREGAQYENNDESLFEVQFLDYGTQGTDDEWTPVNTSKNATQGSAIESPTMLLATTEAGLTSECITVAVSTLQAGAYDRVATTSTRVSTGHIGTYESDWDTNDQTLGNVMYYQSKM